MHRTSWIAFLIAFGCTTRTPVPDGGTDASTSPRDSGSIDAFVPPRDGAATDRDRDGFEAPEDCDDDDEDVHPDAPERCNGSDDDCDLDVDEDPIDATALVFADTDHDTYGDDETAMRACETGAGFVDRGGDCDDTQNGVYPGATETCNGVDDDCNDFIDNGLDLEVWHEDYDGDGFGSATSTVMACMMPPSYVADATDCDDFRGGVHPGADEVCNGLSDDCDVPIDEDGVCDGCTPRNNGLRNYVFCVGPATWQEARDRCAVITGYALAEISDGLESLWIRNRADELVIDDYWVGANDLDTEGSWVWDGSGAVVGALTQWGPSEPNGGTAENCGSIPPPGIQLYSEACDAPKGIVCEQR